ncbi:hypothetical protein ABW19_dt0203440 [Dactylella cylindrospora]|nr:hypothetical protein ABW19_dt0203440 [Dactylella cylindrospora]
MAEAPAEKAQKSKPLFHDVNFTLIRGPNFTGKEYDTIRELLLDGGAVEVDHEKSSQGVPTLNLDETTHIVAPDIEFTEFSELERRRLAGEIDQRMLTVVKPDWVTDSAKKGKTQHIRAYNADPRMIFSGIDAVIVNLPEGDTEAICGGILSMGGIYKTSLSRLTTHIVALNLDNNVCKKALENGLPVKMVVPHWFDDCLRLNRLIDETPYLLPDPAILTKKSGDPLPYPTINLTHTHDHKDKTDSIPLSLRKRTNIFMNKSFFFAEGLNLNGELQNTLISVLKQGGGTIAPQLKDANVLVCLYREGEDYMYASRKGIDVGNLTWLFWMISREEWVLPTKFLLHYPKAKIPVPGMENCLISVSNYSGDARMYLENLIEAAGATFTRAMKPDNTHLITARDYSDKVDAAREWNTNLVNHIWLEETYAKWEMQTLTNPKYTTFPKRTNLMEVVGQTRIDLEAISHVFFPPEDEGDDEEEEAAEDGDVDMADAETADELEGGKEEDEAEEDEKVEQPVKRRGRKSKDGKAPKLAVQPTEFSGRNMETPRPNKRLANIAAETPKTAILSSSPPMSTMSTGSRKAKENATKKLHDIMPDVLQYEKEKKRKGGVTHGGRRSDTPEGEVTKGPKKRSLPAETDGDPMDEDEQPEKPKKLKKKSIEKVNISVYLLLTSHTPWIDNPSQEDDDRRILREIGIQCIENPDAHMTHLSAPHLVRTEKFVCALARAPVIVTAKWVQECIKQKAIVDTKPYLLKDPDGEKKLKINLSDSLARAKQNEGMMLEGLYVYITPNVGGGWETFKKIVEANGGMGYLFKAVKRGGVIENKDASTTKKLVLVSAAKDEKLWNGFRKMAKEAGWDPLVYRTDWLLDVAMGQKMVWSDKYFISNQR